MDTQIALHQPNFQVKCVIIGKGKRALLQQDSLYWPASKAVTVSEQKDVPNCAKLKS
ncbi:hypothetical protein lacNasYZ03_00080 [Lactobacillus nasalidis]|uniref:Uncharacterized protein n=1 Tax=Lactobacillus nasalidis TaxID=2797258 RepID=A0ABQ3W4F2_9LACO|nr:hypothetical protein lacNasYZ01_06510 [Lactobacillus nasalidis]GHV99520.1 hypothetical protein lacNasYZ02_09500 [Lactobacillus nasalidis]GHW00321.1 hypothetical protein lacNasYZ03_00080 [Lactobacillus nasalidis]